jgi:hypothetical protein
VGVSTHTLKRIPPIKPSKSAQDPGTALVAILADHEEYVEAAGLPEACRVTGRQIKAVYERGLRGWPGAEVTTLSRKAWAVERADYFTKVAALAEERVSPDVDLLPPGHPLAEVDDEDVDPIEPAMPSLFEEAEPIDGVEPVDAPAGMTPVGPPAAAEEGTVTLTPEQIQADLERVLSVPE